MVKPGAWVDYPPHEYKVHRRVRGGGFVCNPNFKVRKSTDVDAEVTCRTCLHFMREQDREENMGTKNVIDAADEKIAALKAEGDKLRADLVGEKGAHEKTKASNRELQARVAAVIGWPRK